ncbi:MAG TPA: 3-hydroxybutyryl-CoA dehydrogenase [Verrucomicrobiae bacterium]|nr:3-hydroxybutyryl-CoA dehydrogenase [Verrucomicrobiae bacterium]
MVTIRKVGVLGCGLMGSGIAQVCAQSGIDTVVLEAAPEILEKGLGRIRSFLQGGVDRGKLSAPDRDATLARLRGTTDLAALADRDLVIEAVVEDLKTKRDLFAKLDAVCGPETIFASNTSSLSITEIMTATKRRDRFVGLHFFNPVPLMKLVEVVRTFTTAEAVHDGACAFVQALGKTPIRTKDATGFIVNRLLVPYILDAIRALEEGVGTIRDIDEGMKLGCGHPMGPLTLLDFVGLDTTLSIAEIMFEEFRERRFAPPPLLKRMVLSGYHGKKSGKGFYDWSAEPPRANDYLVGGGGR